MLRLRRAATGTLALGLLSTACQAVHPYFDFPSRIGQAFPAAVDDRAYVLVWTLAARGGDSVELMDLELVDAEVDNLSVTPLAVDMSTVGQTGIGIVRADQPGDAARAVAELRPLSGFTYRATDDVANLHVVVLIDPKDAGIATVAAYRLTFSVNGGPPRTQEIPSELRVCVDDPPPASCEMEGR